MNPWLNDERDTAPRVQPNPMPPAACPMRELPEGRDDFSKDSEGTGL